MVSKVTDLNGISRYCSLVKHREFKGYYNKPKYTPFLQFEYTCICYKNNLKISRAYNFYFLLYVISYNVFLQSFIHWVSLRIGQRHDILDDNNFLDQKFVYHKVGHV